MSTRRSLAGGKNFHFYKDLADFDTDNVYLEIRKECSCNTFKVLEIPADVWEVIRHIPALTFEWVDKTDEELRAFVEAEVDKRIKEYQEADEKSKGWVAFCGSLSFGSADEPREDQIRQGLEYFLKVRDYELGVREKMAQHTSYVTADSE